MQNKLLLIVLFGGMVALVWGLSMLSTPRKGITKLLEHTASGAIMCLICYSFLAPFGISIPQSPVSALLTGWLGLPGMAFAAFLSKLP